MIGCNLGAFQQKPIQANKLAVRNFVILHFLNTMNKGQHQD